jgi:hypothetical protein
MQHITTAAQQSSHGRGSASPELPDRAPHGKVQPC